MAELTSTAADDQQGKPILADLWDDGCAAARQGELAKALGYFSREADLRTQQHLYGRAAIAFRAAAQQAWLAGDAHASKQLLRQAADAYLQAADEAQLSDGVLREALLAAAKCFLCVEDVEAAFHCMERARRCVEARKRVG